MLDRDRVSSHPAGGKRNSAGVGNVIILADLDRSTYISNCFKNNTVSILTENSERIDNVLVNKSSWNDIEFPKNTSELGSRIVWLNIPKHNQPIIVAVIDKKEEVNTLSENELNLSKTIKGLAHIEISATPKDGGLLIQVEGLKDDLGDITIKTSNKNLNSKINLISDGEVNIEAKKLNATISNGFNIQVKNLEENNLAAKISYVLRDGFHYFDEFDNTIDMDEEKIQIQTGKQIILGEGKEPIVLAETCKRVLDEFIDLVSQITTTTMLGQMPILNATQVAKMKEKTESIYSKLVKSD